jgi:E3 ubiquitin-protein ligase UBR2
MNSDDDLLVRGCFLPAPYLDDYGETDQGLRRGNPLRLCKSRYNKLYRDWLSHAIPDEVSRSYQNTQSIMNVDWIQL